MTLRSVVTFGIILATACSLCAAQADVRVEPTQLQGPRPLEEQTKNAAVRNYLQAWETLRTALEGNDIGPLDRDFTGTARDKLAETVQQQAAAGIHTRYQDKSHEIKIVFYSPDGLSLELTDEVEYDVQMFDRDKQLSTQQVHARYVVVLTPAEVRWRVRVFQAQSE